MALSVALGSQPPAFGFDDNSFPQPPQLSDAKIELLRQMFPDIESDVLSQLLSYHKGSVEDVVSAMLETADADSQETADASVARRLQAEQDEEMARAVQASLQEELRVEQERQKEKELPAVAARAVGAATANAKAFLQRMRTGTAPSRLSSTHRVALLDAPLESTGAPYDMSPLAAHGMSPLVVPSTYAPPSATLATLAPPPAATPATLAPPPTAPVVDVTDDEPRAHATSDLPSAGDARYSSRMERARASNSRQRGLSRQEVGAEVAPQAETLAPLQAGSLVLSPAAQVHVPEGELI